MIRTLLSLRKLLQAANEHQQVEKIILARFATLLEPRYQSSPEGRVNRLQYLQKNFFSSLFLSIYTALGIPSQRRQLYGQINHCIRGLVTACDNLLDDEYKELLPFNFPEPAIRFKSVMHLLCLDRILEKIARQAVLDDLISQNDLEPLLDTIFQAMVPIGAEEAMEEGGITEILSPKAVLDSVHMYKGGKLLCLAFTAPLLLESKQTELLRLAETGIYQIGMALQVIDDLTDFYEDIQNQNHNYLLSMIHHAGDKNEQQRLSAILQEKGRNEKAIESLFTNTVKKVMAQAIGEALAGFASLEAAGYWYKEKQAITIIRFLFTIRGVGHLLAFFPKPGHCLRLSMQEDPRQ
ncbi:MAG: class 1 isoprenoid biosynthesis enzyme [Desulfobulbaceae bacterium]|nr:class 1 isoprenoid biosynthesis enzyme [Desulfobulbaceae bacterium]